MIRTDLLTGLIAQHGLSKAAVARELGVTPQTFYGKMKKGVFDSNEIEKMIDLLEIEHPINIFFAKR